MPERCALLTGGSGFFGRYLAEALSARGYPVTNLDIRATDARTIECNLEAGPPDLSALEGPPLVVHAAGRAHVNPRTEEEAAAFFRTNLEGTRNLTAALDRLDDRPVGLVFISTVAVYGRESGVAIDETSPIGATTPYGRSKAEAEEHLRVWGERAGVGVLILRLPLLAGENPPGNLGAMLRAISRGYYLRIGSGEARRSWVWARDVADLAASEAGKSGTYNLTDGQHPSFAAIEAALAGVVHGKVRFSVPMWAARAMGRTGDLIKATGLQRFPFDSRRLSIMTESLTFDDRLARERLDWRPHVVLEHVPQVFGGARPPR